MFFKIVFLFRGCSCNVRNFLLYVLLMVGRRWWNGVIIVVCFVKFKVDILVFVVVFGVDWKRLKYI